MYFFQDHYELIAFIEYMGRIPKNTGSKEVRAHYISYKSVMGQWIRNDDSLCHTAEVAGSYKVNLVFYRAMTLASPCDWIIDTDSMLFWKKAVVIQGVYTPKNKSKRGRRTNSRGTKPVEEENLILPDNSSSSSDSDADKGHYISYLHESLLSIFQANMMFHEYISLQINHTCCVNANQLECLLMTQDILPHCGTLQETKPNISPLMIKAIR